MKSLKSSLSEVIPIGRAWDTPTKTEIVKRPGEEPEGEVRTLVVDGRKVIALSVGGSLLGMGSLPSRNDPVQNGRRKGKKPGLGE